MNDLRMVEKWKGFVQTINSISHATRTSKDAMLKTANKDS